MQINDLGLDTAVKPGHGGGWGLRDPASDLGNRLRGVGPSVPEGDSEDKSAGGGVVVADSYLGLGGAVAEIPVEAGLAGRDEALGVNRQPGVEGDAVGSRLLLQDQRAGPTSSVMSERVISAPRPSVSISPPGSARRSARSESWPSALVKSFK